MRNMTWKPDPARDDEINAYLDEMNRAPYFTIGAIVFGLFCLFTVVILAGVF